MLSFIKQFLRNPRQTGAIVKVGKLAMRKCLSSIDRETDKIIIEFGPGEGNITKEILKKMNADSKIIAIEINESFCEKLQKIKDKRLVVIQGSALDISHQKNKYFPNGVDIIVSTMPLTSLSDSEKNIFYNQILTNLKDTGEYIQLQYSTITEKYIKKHFPRYTTDRELLNIPPACIFHCYKK